jgi:ribonucleoside-diphosphate reductase alpha chain
MVTTPTFLAPISEEIWTRKYRFGGGQGVAADQSLSDTFSRVARAAASVEKGGKRVRDRWARVFFDAMEDFGFLPAGRILAGAGTGRDVTLFNCFVLGRIDDDLSAIFDGLKDAALAMQAGGGIGHDFSTIRPKGARVMSIGADASGPVSFMDVWDAMCRTIMSAGQRRGAMMATLRCDHPDIEEFIAAKHDPTRLRNFNLSVLVTDQFMEAIKTDADWPLTFEGTTYKSVSARALWEKLMRATYDYAEPGVIFIDRVNAMNNLQYCETISATNPCGEQPLPPHGACLLGSINLARLVDQPFSENAKIDQAALRARVSVAVRLLDNMIDYSRYPLDALAKEARAKRRVGLGVTGLADALIFCGLHYDSDAARTAAAQWMQTIQNAAYEASAELAKEKGAFSCFERDAFLERPNVRRLDQNVRDKISAFGIRNGCLTSIAPTGTISLLAGNVSSGIEPVFGFRYTRRVLENDATAREQVVQDFAYSAFMTSIGQSHPHHQVPQAFVTAEQLTAAAHLQMQAALQPHVDSAISKTINCPQDMPFEAFRDIYMDAFALGLKGCTTFRPNAITGSVLSSHPVDSSTEAPRPNETVTSRGVSKSSAQSYAATIEDGDDEPSSSSSQSVVYLAKPLERDASLEGVTYKIKWPASPHALYVTINDIVRDGRRRPFEIFINTKNLEHYAWTVALTRMVSAIFRRGGDVSFVAEELKAVFDPEGGRWMAGRYVPSLLAAIGDVIEQHLIRIGFTRTPSTEKSALISTSSVLGAQEADQHAAASTPRTTSDHRVVSGQAAERTCPRCGRRGLRRVEGCWTCSECNYSHCG